MSDSSPRVWFITGASRGLGRAVAEAALARGDRVAATARDPGTLADLVAAAPERAVALRLDVTAPGEAQAAVDAALGAADARKAQSHAAQTHSHGHGHKH
jgi:NAD(P)-dependent dehydrogenase (short-subunit alcohol dehydrogenase family)